MSRIGRRALMALVGVGFLAFYGVVAYVVYEAFVALWAVRPDPLTALLALVVVTLLTGYLSYRFGSRRLLSGLGAVPLPASRVPELSRRLDRLCASMEIERPQLYVARMATPNAFAVGGPSGGSVVLDRSLFRLLDADELEGIVAHELAHLESHDGLVQTLAQAAMRTISGVVVVALFPVLVIVSGFARGLAWLRGRPEESSRGPLGRVPYRTSQLVLLLVVTLTALSRAYSRKREYAADDRAAAVTKSPLALARAIRKIERASEPRWWFGSPLSTPNERDGEGLAARLLATHPTTEDRVERLVEEADEQLRERATTIPIR